MTRIDNLKLVMGLLLAVNVNGVGYSQKINEPASIIKKAKVAAKKDSFEESVIDLEQAKPMGKKDADVSAANAESDDAEGWDSYEHQSEQQIAEGVTKGVRVEDIVEPPSDYHFAAFGRSDPFIPPMILQEVSSIEVPIVSPLQKYSLDKLKVLGIWQLDNGQRKALIMPDNGGEGIITKVDDPIGNRGGKITMITESEVKVREFTLTPDGTRQFEDKEIRLGGVPSSETGGRIVFTPGAEGPVMKDDHGEVMKLPETPAAKNIPEQAPTPGGKNQVNQAGAGDNLKKEGEAPAIELPEIVTDPNAHIRGGATKK